MPNLSFCYGCMGSSKTAQALIQRHQFMKSGFHVALVKPAFDTRFGSDWVRSRTGLAARGISVAANRDLYSWASECPQYQVIIADEAQFFTVMQVEQLKEIASSLMPVFCYGLKSDFRSFLFPASKRLLELADMVREIPSVCYCGKKAEINARIQEGKIVYQGKTMQLGGEETYVPLCYECWKLGKLPPKQENNQ
jgi:thymidine kinase